MPLEDPLKEKATNMKKGCFRILSIDGGGIRGIIPAAVLLEVEQTIRKIRNDDSIKIGDCFDLIAGTSTGGILTLMFLAPDKNNPARPRFSAQNALDLYMEHGDEIFDISVWRRMRTLEGLRDEKHSAEMLERVLLKYFDDLKLSQLLKPCLVTAYDMKRYRPFFFTQHDAVKDPVRDYLLRDVARATSAAPTYFEVALPENMDDIPNAVPMADGGVFASNPAACALVEVLRLRPHFKISLDQVAILSLGTGRRPTSISYQECRNWGLAQWTKPIIDIFMEGVSQSVNYQLETVFESIGNKAQFLRIDGEFGDFKNNLDIEGLDPAMDNATEDNMKKLLRFGMQLARNHARDIEIFVNNYLCNGGD